MQSGPQCLWKPRVLRCITLVLAHLGLSTALVPAGGALAVTCACRRCESWHPRPPRNGVFCRGNGCQYAEVGRVP